MDPLYIGSSVLKIQRSMHILFYLLHMFIPDEVFTANCLGGQGLNTLGHACPHIFQAFRHRLCLLCFLDFRCSNFASTLFILDQAFRIRLCLRLLQIKRLNFICIILVSITDQTFRLRLLQIKRSDFAFIWIKCSDFICIMLASFTVQTFRLRLLHIRRSDFAFIWIRCSDFICITISSSAVQTFKLRLL